VLFTGTRCASSVSLGIGPRERFAVLTLTGLLLVGGIVPQFNIASRHHAAEELLEARHALALDAPYDAPRTLVTEADDAPHQAIKPARKE
jgi:NADH-quinone oxidoreductase subunit M